MSSNRATESPKAAARAGITVIQPDRAVVRIAGAAARVVRSVIDVPNDPNEVLFSGM